MAAPIVPQPGLDRDHRAAGPQQPGGFGEHRLQRSLVDQVVEHQAIQDHVKRPWRKCKLAGVANDGLIGGACLERMRDQLSLGVDRHQTEARRREQVPASTVERERDIYREQVKGKPKNVVEKIVDGKLDKYYASVCLLDQPFIKNPDQTIKDLISSKIAELGENIIVRRFTRYVVGEEIDAGSESSTAQVPADGEATSG